MQTGKRLKELREQRKMSQNYLADMAGVSQTHLRRVELGTADITVGHLQLICDALGITLRDFFDTDENKSTLSSMLTSLTTAQKKFLVDYIKTL